MKMPEMKNWRGVAVALALGTGLVAPPALAADDTYDMNVIIPLTGGGAFLGKAENQALGVAVQVINKDGGIHGKKIKLDVHDDQSSPQVAVQLMTEVIATHPAVILGSTVSQLCNAQAPLVKEAGPVMWCFSPSVRTEPGGYEFTSQIDSHDQQRALMTYFKGKGWKHIALITTTDASGQDAEKSITDLVKDPAFKDMKLVADEHFAPSDVTVSAQIEKLRAGNPDAIVSWATTAAGGTVFRALKQAGMDLPTAASGSNMTVSQMSDYAAFLPTKVFFGVGEWAANGDPRLKVPAEVTAQQKLFFNSMKTINVYPDSGYDLGWEPIRVVADALNKLPAGADAKTLHDFLINWQGHIGAEGVYDFKKTPQRGLNIDNAVVVRWDPKLKQWHLVSNLTGTPLE
ncbi:MAG TPA: ABC transporter substrate-binding protein [Stellaceae bacterium]|jgi:branched-chain amino acid transport system substrate-binding protein